jgi:hypothetical protein
MLGIGGFVVYRMRRRRRETIQQNQGGEAPALGDMNMNMVPMGMNFSGGAPLQTPMTQQGQAPQMVSAFHGYGGSPAGMYQPAQKWGNGVLPGRQTTMGKRLPVQGQPTGQTGYASGAPTSFTSWGGAASANQAARSFGGTKTAMMGASTQGYTTQYGGSSATSPALGTRTLADPTANVWTGN